MKILLIIYVVSWLLMLIIYLLNYKIASKEKKTWSFYVFILVAAPLVVIITPIIIFQNYRQVKKRNKSDENWETMLAEKKAKENAAKERFNTAATSHEIINVADYVSVARYLHKLAMERHYDSFLDCLDKVDLPSGEKLIVEECDESGHGDESKLIVLLPNGEKDDKIFDHLIVEPSCMGAWQGCLLHTLWHVLPLWWHSNYSARDYVFSKEHNSRENRSGDVRNKTALDNITAVAVWCGLDFIAAIIRCQ